MFLLFTNESPRSVRWHLWRLTLIHLFATFSDRHRVASRIHTWRGYEMWNPSGHCKDLYTDQKHRVRCRWSSRGNRRVLRQYRPRVVRQAYAKTAGSLRVLMPTTRGIGQVSIWETQLPFDLLLTGGRVIDPSQSLDRVGVTSLIVDGRIAHVGPNLD